MMETARLLAVCDLLTEPRSHLDYEGVVATGAEQFARLVRADLGAVMFEYGGGTGIGSYPHSMKAQPTDVLERHEAGRGEPGAVCGARYGDSGGFRVTVVATGPVDGSFSRLDDWLAMVVARRVHAQLELVALHESRLADAAIVRDAELAGELQSALMPHSQLHVGAVDVAGMVRSAGHVGGDVYDIQRVDDHVVVLLADVSGKGAAASLLGASVLAAGRHAVSSLGADPVAVVRAVGDEVGPLLDRTGRIVTLAIVAVGSTTGIARIASAGHSPVLVRQGDDTTLVPPGAPPLGTGSRPISETVARLELGDLVLVASDGLIDQRGMEGMAFGLTRLEHAVQHVAAKRGSEVIDAVMGAVDGFAGSAHQDDDQTAVAFVVGSPQRTRSEHRAFSLDLAGLEGVGAWLNSVLAASARWITADQQRGVLLGVHEILVNVLRHAYRLPTGRAELVVTTDADACRITIVDGGAAFEGSLQRELPDGPAAGGYGLPIVDAVFDHVGYRREADQNCWSLVLANRYGGGTRS